MKSPLLVILGTQRARLFFLLLALAVPEPDITAQTPERASAPNTEPREAVVLELWPDKAPDEIGDVGPERARTSPKLDRKQVEVTEPTRLITDVTKPSITICRPPRENNGHTGVLICPGGGYWDLYWQLEGEEVATWLNSSQTRICRISSSAVLQFEI